METNMPVNDHQPSFFGRGVLQNTGIIATDTDIDVSAYTSNTTANSISSFTLNGPYVINTGAIGATGGTTNYNYQTSDWQNKRMDVRDNGKIPVDIWAMMYNNGVIDD
jgi:hypothetical protein